jgi:Cu/Ag efflux protein CusF
MSVFRRWNTGVAVCILFLSVSVLQAQENEEQPVPAVVTGAVTEDVAMPQNPGVQQVPVDQAPEAAMPETPQMSAGTEPQMNVQEIAGGIQDVGEKPVPALTQTVPSVQVMDIKMEEAPTEWIWGEVVSVDPSSSSITIKHLDYDTYEEVRTVLTFKEKTLFENVRDMAEIVVGDRVTADYRTQDGQNLVEMVVVDRPVNEQATGAPVVIPQAPVVQPEAVSQEATVPAQTVTPAQEVAPQATPEPISPVIEEPISMESMGSDNAETTAGMSE